MRVQKSVRDAMIRGAMVRIVTGRRFGKLRGKGIGETYIVDNSTKVSTRYCSRNESQPVKFKYNINPVTLAAEYGLWMCGDVYYLVPVSILGYMHSHPYAYPDRAHPGYTVVTVDVARDEVMYASGGRRMRLTPYRNALLP